jgi:hypothetical protein
MLGGLTGGAHPMATNQTHHNTHPHHNGARSNGTRNSRPAGSKQPQLQRLRSIVVSASQLPEGVQAKLKAHPAATVATIAGASFVFGALAGSRLGRIAIAAAIPLVLKRIIEGDVGQEIAQYAKGLVNAASGTHAADA